MLRLRALRPVERVKREWPFPVINDVYPGCCLQALPINYPFEDMRRSRANHPAEFFQPVSYRIWLQIRRKGSRFYDHMRQRMGAKKHFIDVELDKCRRFGDNAYSMRLGFDEKRPRGRPKNVKISLNRPIRVGSLYYLDDKPRFADSAERMLNFHSQLMWMFRRTILSRATHLSRMLENSVLVFGHVTITPLDHLIVKSSPVATNHRILNMMRLSLNQICKYFTHDNQEIDIYGAPMDDYGQDLATHSGVDYGTEYITGDAVNHLPVVEDVEVKRRCPSSQQSRNRSHIEFLELYYVNGSGKTTFVRVGAPPLSQNPMTQHAEEPPVVLLTKAGYAKPPRRTIRILKRLLNKQSVTVLIYWEIFKCI
ncbi:unnamed protein product, partial [Mesorhabditis spiculigera]